MAERRDTITCRRLAELDAWRTLRPIVDPLLDIVRLDCAECQAQLTDPLELHRPVVARVRDGRVTIRCDACERTYLRA